MLKKTLLILLVLLLPGWLYANTLSWSEWVSQLRTEAIAQGIRANLFDQIFAAIPAPSARVLHFDRSQPEKRISFYKYRSTRADAYRLKIGKQELKRHAATLNAVASQFGVSPCFIVALWGLESSYGHFMGNFPVIQSLATLAYDSRRGDFFRKQLLIALAIVNEGQIRLQDFKGEWAGASGQCQFLPSSWRQYAVDFDRDGKKDIWKSYPDVFASIANYLAKNGWAANQPWALPVQVPHPILDKSMHPLSYWKSMGIVPIQRNWPSTDSQARLVTFDGGPAFLVFNNFNVIMRWNHSNYYAGTVGYAAEQICNRTL